MNIISITSQILPGTSQALVMGLGDDNRVYMWSAQLGAWVPNWNQQKPPAPVVGEQKLDPKKATKKAKK